MAPDPPVRPRGKTHKKQNSGHFLGFRVIEDLPGGEGFEAAHA